MKLTKQEQEQITIANNLIAQANKYKQELDDRAIDCYIAEFITDQEVSKSLSLQAKSELMGEK